MAAAAPPLEPLPLPPAARLGRSNGGYGLFAGAGLAWLAVLALAWRMIPGPAAPAHHGRSIALVGFSNLSRNAKDAWLAPALTEMLGTELNATDSLQVVPDEVVRGASTDIESPAAGGYAPQTLTRLRRRLDADYVVSGSYLVTGSAEDAPLRIDLAVQDSRSGVVLAAVSSQSGLSGLIGLVTRAGASLRAKLGAAPSSAAALDLVAHEQPPSLDVARRLGFALDALHHYDPARARDELLEAIAESPGYAPGLHLPRPGLDGARLPGKGRGGRRAGRAQCRTAAGRAAPAGRGGRAGLARAVERGGAHLGTAGAPEAPQPRVPAAGDRCTAGRGGGHGRADDSAWPAAAAGQRPPTRASSWPQRVSPASRAMPRARRRTRNWRCTRRSSTTRPASSPMPRLRSAPHWYCSGPTTRRGTDLNAAIEGYRAIHNPRGEADARA